jgi:hypothetical protein
MCKTRLVSKIAQCFFGEIQSDLRQVVGELRQEARGDLAAAPPMAGQGGANEYPLQAALLLLSAKFGDYDFERLKPAAVGVELLDLAVRKHYPKPATSRQLPGARDQGSAASRQPPATRGQWPKTRVMSHESRDKKPEAADNRHPSTSLRINPSSDNLALITGDYYYARAVSLGSTFDDTEIVKIMVQAISEIAQGEVESQRSLNESTLKKLASLYSTSCHLGALIGGVSEKMTKTLKKYGLNLGVAYKLVHDMREKDRSQRFLILARKVMADLPANKHRFHLEQLADSII